MRKFMVVGVVVLVLFAALAAAIYWAKVTDDSVSWQSRGNEASELDLEMKRLAKRIQELHGEGACEASAECKVIGLGAKLCDGYNDFLVYSVQDADEAQLLPVVRNFNRAADRLNELSFRVQKCGRAAAPVSCVGGRCRVSTQ